MLKTQNWKKKLVGHQPAFFLTIQAMSSHFQTMSAGEHRIFRVLVYGGLTGILFYQLFLALGKLRDGHLGTLITRQHVDNVELPSMTFCMMPILPVENNKTLVEQYNELKKEDIPILYGVSMANSSSKESQMAAILDEFSEVQSNTCFNFFSLSFNFFSDFASAL